MSLINVGYDASGNGNNWTANNIDNDTTSTSTDVMVDSPSRYGADTGAGGTVRGNYATLNPLSLSYGTLSNGNLNYVGNGSNQDMVVSTVGQTTGKWYCEVTLTNAVSADQYSMSGVVNLNSYTPRYSPTYPGGNAASWGYYPDDGGNPGIYNNNARTDTLAAGATNDVIGMALDCDAGTLSWYKNNSLLITKTIGSGNWAFVVGHQTANCNINFGQRPFAYTAPSGFKALVTTNLPTPTIADGEDYFNTVLWTGTGSGQSITGMGFQPDWLWFKQRNGTSDPALMDAVRGATKGLRPNTTGAEVTSSAGQDLVSFDADGFTTGTPTNFGSLGGSGFTIVTWGWKANGSGVSNTDGSITSTVSVNTDSGFSIVTWSQGASNQNVGHGLGVTPAMIIGKTRSNSGFGWHVFHQSLGVDKYIFLNLTNGAATSSGIWSTLSSTTFGASLGLFEANQTQVAYCFAPVAGYSAMSSYVGNNSSDGPFVFTGFRPAYILIKSTASGTDWCIYDAKRLGYNVDNNLQRNAAAAEQTDDDIDFLSNGFKFRRASPNFNGSGTTHIYMAFAENPFKLALAR